MKTGMLVLAAALAAGCAMAPTGRYGNPDDDVYGRKERMEYTQKSRSVAEMLGRMVTDPDFTDIYGRAEKRAAARGHQRPTVIVGRIEDNTHPGSNDCLSTLQMRQELKAELRKTKLFAVIDLAERQRMQRNVVADSNGGAANDNLQAIGAYAAGDFTMEGELLQESSGSSHFHFFDLRLTDTTSGVEVWSDIVRIRKD